MKPLPFKIFKIVLAVIVLTGCDNNNPPSTRSSEKIEVFINGSTTPLVYNDNIIAKDYPLPLTSGFSNQFVISSEDAITGDTFDLTFPPTATPAPFVIATPTTETISALYSQRLTIDGFNFDDTAANSLTVTYTAFGSNTGNNIEINLNGTYFLIADTVPHTLNINLEVKRDANP